MIEMNVNVSFIPSDTTELIMKVVMHELDYDMDDDDLEFLKELNQYMEKDCMSLIYKNFDLFLYEIFQYNEQ